LGIIGGKALEKNDFTNTVF